MKLNQIFASNMVLPAKRPIRIFGTGKGEADIKFNGAAAHVISSEEKWCITLPAMEYGGPYTLEFIADGKIERLENVFVGEVYLFAGQSNIAFMLSASNTPKEDYEELDNLRLYAVHTDNIYKNNWRPARLGEIDFFSALGYLSGKTIAKAKGIAVGIIQCAQGASVIESWVPEGAFEKIGINIPPEAKHGDHEEYHEWNIDGFLYGKKLTELIPLTLSGVVWYQGESDASEVEGLVYEKELSELIRIWRELFRDESLPFTVVQLADTHERMAQGPGWELVQRAQAEISRSVSNVYTVISRDFSENDDVHPQSKKPLAERVVKVILEKYF